MLAGMVFTAIVAGALSLTFSVAAGHPPLIWLLAYCLSGFCGILAYILGVLQMRERRG